jgi:RES domain
LSDETTLTSLGVDMSRFGQLSYRERTTEHARTQEVAEVAHFLDHAGIVVPCARWTCSNVVVFCDRSEPGSVEPVKDHGLVDWTDWQAKNRDPQQL